MDNGGPSVETDEAELREKSVTNLDSELLKQSTNDESSDIEMVTLDPSYEAELGLLDDNLILITNDADAIDFSYTEPSNCVAEINVSNTGTSNETTLGMKCFKCDFYTTLLDDFKNHMVEHPNVLDFVCMQCNYRTRNRHHYFRHLIRYSYTEMHQCDLCLFGSKYKSTLLKHRKSHEEVTYNCTACDFTSKNRGNLRRHYAQHEKTLLKCEQCSYSSSRKNIVKHLRTHTNSNDMMHHCNVCQYKSATLSVVARHMLIHMKVAKLECEICGYVTSYARLLSKHTKKHKDDDGNYKCAYCTYTTDDGENLRSHYDTSHYKKKLKCNHCDYVTYYRKSFNSHLTNHK